MLKIFHLYKEGKLTLAKKPSQPIKYVYKLVKNQLAEILTLAEAGGESTTGTFTITDSLPVYTAFLAL